jgi:hypothetical protein
MPHGDKKSKMKSWTGAGIAAHDESMHARFAVVHHKTVRLLG